MNQHGVAINGIPGHGIAQSQLKHSPGSDDHHADETSLIAEYALMLMTAHAAFCGLMRLTVVAPFPMAVAGMVASVWIVVRTIHASRVGWYCPVVTLSSAAAVLQWDGLPWPGSMSASASASLLLSGGVFSPLVLLVMLGVILCGDVAGLVRKVTRDALVRNRVGEFLMRHGLRSLVWGIGGFIAVYTFVVPLVQEWVFRLSDMPSNPKFAMDRLTVPQNMLFKFSESVSGMWFFVIGTCVGSFLNVVIYRIPAGISVVAKASHCPGCQQAIRGRDNLPLVGWLKLQGRCRNCQTDISSRYPTVELTIGLMFLLLYFVELISGGTNLPGRTPNHYAGVLWILFYTKWDLIGLYVFHCFVMCALFSWAMIRRDGHRVPLKSVAITLAIVIAAVLLQPQLLPWTYNAAATSTEAYSLRNAVMSMLVGVFAAVLLQCASTLVQRSSQALGRLSGYRGDARRDHRQPAENTSESPGDFRYRQVSGGSPFTSWLLIGMALGWQAVVGVLLTLAIWTLLRAVSRITSPAVTSIGNSVSPVQPAWLVLPTAVLLHHCVWRQLASCFNGWVVS